MADPGSAKELAAAGDPPVETRETRRYPRTLEPGATADLEVPVCIGEFWTARQRAASPLHEVSYRACFKPQLPRFFVERFSRPGERVLDPFMGRGTTLLEAALLGRRVAGNDLNPLAPALIAPRLDPPTQDEVVARLQEVDWQRFTLQDDGLLTFYHPETLQELGALRAWLLERDAGGDLDPVDGWIRMVAVNRLTGHSPGFFSVYTLPPNQAVTVASQRRINERRGQTPPRREVPERIAKKSAQLLRRVDGVARQALRSAEPLLSVGDAAALGGLADGSVDLVVTSPPFLDIVQYKADNWLRCWFCGIDPDQVAMPLYRTPQAWGAAMARVFEELFRVVRPGGHCCFEVGEVRRGKVQLEDAVVPAAVAAGWHPVEVLLHVQDFTKTANCWGVANNKGGTNTQRIVVLRRPG